MRENFFMIDDWMYRKPRMLWLFVNVCAREVHDYRIIVIYLRKAVDHEAASEMKLIKFVYEAAQKIS